MGSLAESICRYMKRSIVPLALILLVSLSFTVFKHDSPSPWISFDAGMSKASSSFVNCYSSCEGWRWKWLKNLYEKGLAKRQRAAIPKTIHQIWLGGPLP